MQIIEQQLVAKHPAKKSEDSIVVTDDFVAVIDGSTSKTDYRHSLLRSNGRYAMQLVSRYIRRMPKTTTCEAFLRGLLDGTFNYYTADHDSIEVEIQGDHARMTGCSRVLAAVYGGRKNSWRLRGDFTLRRENGTWKFTRSKASTY